MSSGQLVPHDGRVNAYLGVGDRRILRASAVFAVAS
jgi:hypothetical protein